jgi:hypothetical protein
MRTKFDPMGNIIEQAYFGINGKPCQNYQGVAWWTATYTEKGEIIGRMYYDINGKPIL